MFQKLGLKDVFVGLWNRRIRILIILAIAVLLAVINVVPSLNLFKENSAKEKKTYYKTLTLFVDAVEKSEYIDMYYQSQKVRNSYQYAFDSDIFAQYLQDNIKTEEPLGSYLEKSKTPKESISVPDKNILSIYNALEIEAPTDTSTLKIGIHCTDDEIGNKIIDSALTYARVELKGKLNDSNIYEVGRTSYEIENNQSQNFSLRAAVVSIIKKCIIYGVLLEAIYFVVVLTELMFNPVINRKKDFETYTDAPVWDMD